MSSVVVTQLSVGNDACPVYDWYET